MSDNTHEGRSQEPLGPDKAPELDSPSREVALLAHPENALSTEFAGVYLGALGNGRFRDRSETPVPEAGLLFGVAQASYGYTGIYAKPMPGFTIEGLDPDASSPKTMWRGAANEEGEVNITSDSGRMSDLLPHEDWTRANMGNQGSRFGVVRVTDAEGQAKYYVLNADFRGREDGWHVNGQVVEVVPDERLSLPATKSKELTIGDKEQDLGDDPTLLGGNIVKGLRIDSQVVKELKAAFRHETPGIWILHAPEHSVEAVSEFTLLALDLLIEIAKTNPDLMEDTEAGIDAVGRRARGIGTQSLRAKGYVHLLEDEETMRVNYLTTVRQHVDNRHPTQDNAHSYQSTAEAALKLLSEVISGNTSFMLDADSELASRIAGIVERERQGTAEARAKRAEVLQETVLNPNWKREGVEYRAAIPGQKIQMELSDAKPLLTEEQTYHAFFFNNRTDTGSARTEGYFQPTLAILDINGSQYVLIDTRKPSGSIGNARSTKTGNTYSKGERDSGQFKLLQVVGRTEDPRHGGEVLEDDLSFDRDFDKDIQVIRDLREKVEYDPLNLKGTDRSGTGVTIEFDDYTNRIVILAPDKRVGVTTAKGTAQIVPTEPIDNESLDKRLKVKEWEKDVRGVKRRIAALRERLEAPLREDVESGRITQEAAEKRQAEIDRTVARGPARSYTYNGFTGDKWHRSQTYYESVDDEGNIWGDFEEGRYEIGITGQPVSPGRHIMFKNPTKK